MRGHLLLEGVDIPPTSNLSVCCRWTILGFRKTCTVYSATFHVSRSKENTPESPFHCKYSCSDSRIVLAWLDPAKHTWGLCVAGKSQALTDHIKVMHFCRFPHDTESSPSRITAWARRRFRNTSYTSIISCCVSLRMWISFRDSLKNILKALAIQLNIGSFFIKQISSCHINIMPHA